MHVCERVLSVPRVPLCGHVDQRVCDCVSLAEVSRIGVSLCETASSSPSS